MLKSFGANTWTYSGSVVSRKARTQHWYVKRAEAFIRAAGGRKLLEHTADDINHYLEEQGRKAGTLG